ncbi:hypothetical protein L6303_03740 [archaeon]|nr:hypothetical protein [archaeon]
MKIISFAAANSKLFRQNAEKSRVLKSLWLFKLLGILNPKTSKACERISFL